MITRGQEPYAVFSASCYDHRGMRESWIDVVFGTWGQGGTDYTDHVTFSCRFGPVEGSTLPAATAVDGASVAPAGPPYGQKLGRKAALQHPMLSEFWSVVDLIARQAHGNRAACHLPAG